MTNRVINITPTASGQQLKETLEVEARKRGMKLRPFVGQILTYSVENQKKFSKPLKEARPKGGAHIGAIASEEVKKKLVAWAKKKKTARGLWCCFILEKTLEDKLLDEIFVNKNDNS